MEGSISSAEYAAMAARENSRKARKLEEKIDIIEYEINRLKQENQQLKTKLKQIVENCMHTLEYFKGIGSTIAYGRCVEAEKVLNELEIEEIDE